MDGTTKVAVLGGGSWGTALAKLLADKGQECALWVRRAEQARAIQQARENAFYLPGIGLGERLTITDDLGTSLDGAGCVVVVVPSHGLRSMLARANDRLPRQALLVSATKGIETESLNLISDVYADCLPEHGTERLTHLSGPSFAREVAQGDPTAVCIAGESRAAQSQAQRLFQTDRFRVYTTDDVVGVQLGGALKNVIALAAGCAEGLGFGHNSRAALITRGLAEISRLSVEMGANPLTVSGLSGAGDLILTCTGALSRNRAVGIKLGEGQSLESITADMSMVAEGIRTARSAHGLAARHGVEMPITREVYRVLYKNKPPLDALRTLTSRPPRPERDD